MNARVPVYEVSEWTGMRLPGIHLSYKDSQLADQLENEGRIEILDLWDGIRIQARSWVGILRFENFQLNVIPKLAGDNLGLVEMLVFTLGIQALRRTKGLRDLNVEKGGDLLDLLALLLVEECEAIVNNGLLYDYIDHEEDLPVLRGRLLVKPQIRKRLGRIDRIECRFDDHSSDIIENRILLAALRVCGKFVSNLAIRRQLHRLSAIFSSVCTLEIHDFSDARAHLAYNRLNAHYQDAHALSWIIFESLGIKDLYSTGDTHCFAFMLDMNQLFERFVRRYLECILDGTRTKVHYQLTNKSILWNVTGNSSYGNIKPDFVIENENQQRLVIDAKYKLYDDKKISPSDIYQSFLYAYAYWIAGLTQPKAVLLYPSQVATLPSLSLQVRNLAQIVGADLHVIGIHIPLALKEVQQPGLGTQSRQLLEFMSTQGKGEPT